MHSSGRRAEYHKLRGFKWRGIDESTDRVCLNSSQSDSLRETHPYFREQGDETYM